MIFGSSRPNLLPFTYKSFQDKVENLVENTNIRKLFHEDYVFDDKSNKSVEYMKSKGFEVITHKPFIGLGWAMRDMILNRTESPYIFYLQDDWEFERFVDLDRILWTMEKHPKINCITFNKYRNMKPTDFEDKEYDFDSMKTCIYNGWQFLPGVWRTQFTKSKWNRHGTRKERPEGFWQNVFGTHKERLNHKFLEDNVGAYMYGGMGEYRYVKHIGNTWRMAEWRRQGNKTGSGEIHWDFINLKRDRAPWLPPLEKRPMNQDIKLSNEGLKIYEKQDEHIKEIFKDGIPTH